MALSYSVIARKNPSDPTSEFRYYPQPVSNGESDFKSLAKKIQKNTGQNYADVIGVLAALEDILPDELRDGLIVRLGSLGSLYTSYKTTASDTPEDVNDKNIKEVRIRFRPDRDLLEELNTRLEFKKVETKNSGEEAEEE